jgi:magnesium transporter
MNSLPGSDLPAKMAHLIRKHTRRRRRRQPAIPKNLHLPPGELVVSPEELPPAITVFAYGPNAFAERTVTSVQEIADLGTDWPVMWVNVEGLGDPRLLRALAEHFGLHPLAMEDVADTTQRAKVEPYGDKTFVVLPMPHFDAGGFWTEQLSMFISPRVIITFQSAHEGDCLHQIRAHIRESRGRLRGLNAAYLAYAIADATIDAYVPPVNQISDQLDELEDVVLVRPTAAQLLAIRRIRSDLLWIRRAVLPMRDAMTALAALDRVFDQDTRPYLRDLNDHVSRLLDQLETDRFLASDLLDIYMTSVSLRVGEVTKVLTIIATIFIPLSFIASVYGMNFDVMPELRWLYGYPFALALMGMTAGSFMLYFWRKGWLRDNSMPAELRRRPGALSQGDPQAPAGSSGSSGGRPSGHPATGHPPHAASDTPAGGPTHPRHGHMGPPTGPLHPER